jgi:hypothetical protein
MRSILFATLALAAMASAHADTSVEWPFRDCVGLICIDIALDDSAPQTVLLDTGNVNSTMVTDTAQKLGWKPEPILSEGKPIANIQRGGEHRIAIGAEKVPVKFLLLDRSLFGKNVPPADGTLAYSFFKDRRLEIDYPHHRIRVSPILEGDAKSAAPGTLELIKFGEHGPPIVVGSPFTIDGKPVHAQIDTCFTGSLVVYDTAVEKLEIKKAGDIEFFPFTDGGVDLWAGSKRRLGFADRILSSKAKIYFVGGGENPVHQPDGLFEATVGNALFAHSVVTLDFHAMTLDVKPAG